MPDSTRNDQIANLYPLLTMEQIAERFGITRQRVQQILKKRGYTAPGTRAKPWAERFWPRVKFGPGCWEWQGARYPTGYGHFQVGSKDRRSGGYTHRACWEMTFGPIPAGMHVLHHCDNPPCVRPSHLWLGTSADNNHDRDRKGRAKGGPNSPAVVARKLAESA